MQPVWKSLVDQLRADNVDSPYLDRLSDRLQSLALERPIGYGGLQAELVQEMALALGRAEDKVNLALLELELVGRRLDATPGADDAMRTEFNELRDRAVRALWELMVHREALGFYRHGNLDELYPIPPRR